MTSRDVTILMEAHNGLSAKLAQEAGFEALWASGLSISAALGVRDNNEASWTQVLEVLEFMSDASNLPILLDGDTGYGNFNNARRLVRKLEQRNIAGVCLEDKLFPKTNSFIDGEKQMLAAVDEFCGKIRAAKDTQRDPDFMVIARTEAFIAGWGLEEALVRATAYAESGADAILVHSKRKDSKEIIDFIEHWNQMAPIVIVPTKYPTEPISRFAEKGIYNFIFANHSLRTVISALQENLRKLRETSDLMSVEKSIAPVDEIFRLQDVQELKQSEKRYLPETASRASALVLAASKGDFGRLVSNRPKCMLYLRGKPILSWHIEAFRRHGITNIGVVRGYCKEAVDLAGLRYFDNERYQETGELYSLYTARDFLKGDVVIAYGDIVFDDIILQNLIAYPGKIKIAVDASWKVRRRTDQRRDLVATNGAFTPIDNTSCNLTMVGSRVDPEEATGEWIGLVFLEKEKTAEVARLLEEMAEREPALLKKGELSDLLNRLVDSGEEVTVAFSYGHWQDLDEEKDLLSAEQSPGI
jgi:phosphoenolpyruvate phosphomutase